MSLRVLKKCLNILLRFDEVITGKAWPYPPAAQRKILHSVKNLLNDEDSVKLDDQISLIWWVSSYNDGRMNILSLENSSNNYEITTDENDEWLTKVRVRMGNRSFVCNVIFNKGRIAVLQTRVKGVDWTHDAVEILSVKRGNLKQDVAATIDREEHGAIV